MNIIIGDNYGVTLTGGNVLGSVGENILRTHRVYHPRFKGANYILRLRYPDRVIYDTELENGILTVYGSLLRAAGEVEAQFRAVKADDEEERLVFQSEIFKLRIDPAINGSGEEIPPYEESLTMFEKLLIEMKKLGTKSVSRVSLTSRALYGTVVDAHRDNENISGI